MFGRQHDDDSLGVERLGPVALAQALHRVQDSDIEFIRIQLSSERFWRSVIDCDIDPRTLLLEGPAIGGHLLNCGVCTA